MTSMRGAAAGPVGVVAAGAGVVALPGGCKFGAGVAGSYLGNMLQQRGHDVEIFEASKKEHHWPVCAWGASKHMLEKFSDQAGLDFADYIFHVGHRLRMELPNNHEEYLDLNGLVTYDKHKWENDLLRNLKVTYGVKVSREAFRFDKYDYVIALARAQSTRGR